MSTAIHTASPATSGRHMFHTSIAEPQKSAELPALDPATVAKLAQAQVFMENARHAWGKQSQAIQQHAAQLAKAQQYAQATAVQLGLAALSNVTPHPAEVLVHPEVLEELKKQRERESKLAAEIGDSIDAAKRPNMDLLRILGYLDFGDSREAKPGQGGDIDPISNPADKDASGLIWNSHSDFYEQIGLMLGVLKQEWLSKYQDAMKTFLEFYEEFSDILEKIKIVGGNDGDVHLYLKQAKAALETLMQKYGMDENALATFDSKEAAESFVNSLGLPGLKAEQGADGKFRVKMDMSAVEQLHESMIVNGSGMFPWTLDSAAYNAWVSAKDSNVEQIKHVSKVLGEKLNETTQQFDNIVKMLSSTIDKITQADMGFVNGA